jgi:ABC-type nitrate/sulfonate/bicarbonate transport system substrate-binding protein
VRWSGRPARLIGGLAGFAIAAAAAAAGPDAVRIGVTRDAASAPLFIAASAGFFKAAGLDPQLQFLPSDAAVRAAVAAGKLDIGVSALDARFYREAAAGHLKIIASQSSGQAGFPIDALLVGRKARVAGFAGVGDLPGKRIAVSGAESTERYVLYSIATRFGLDPEAMKLEWLAGGRALGALEQGRVDAAVLPLATALKATRKGDLLLPLSNFTTWQQGVVFTGEQTAGAKRALVERFMGAYRQGTAEYQLNFLHYDDGGDFIPGPHHDEYLQLIARQARVPADLLAVTKTYCDRSGALNVADITAQVGFWQARGKLDRKVTASQLLDLSFSGPGSPNPQPEPPTQNRQPAPPPQNSKAQG